MQKNPKTLTSDEVTLLLNYLQNHNAWKYRKAESVRNYTMALLMLDAGLRVNELVQQLTTDLWFENNSVTSLIVTAEIAKNHRERTVPLTARIRAAITEMSSQWWRLSDPSLRIFAFYTRADTIPITTRTVHRIIDNAAMKAYGKHCHPHMLRHTFASRLIKKCNSSIVQELLGHSRLSSTQIYCHPDAEDLQNAIKGLDLSV